MKRNQFLHNLKKTKRITKFERSMEEELNELHAKIEWYNNFIDYIYRNNANDYNGACEYADNLQ